MKIEFIAPIVTATVSSLKTLLGMETRQGQAHASKVFATPQESCYVAVIGMAGSVSGSVVMTFLRDTARKFVGKMVCGDPGSDDDVADGVGEIVNIIAGNAKTILNQQNLGLSLALPNVLQGQEMRVHPPEGVPAIVIPFQCELGDFTVQLAFTQPK